LKWSLEEKWAMLSHLNWKKVNFAGMMEIVNSTPPLNELQRPFPMADAYVKYVLVVHYKTIEKLG
jgi:hypothetical protein